MGREGSYPDDSERVWKKVRDLEKKDLLLRSLVSCLQTVHHISCMAFLRFTNHKFPYSP